MNTGKLLTMNKAAHGAAELALITAGASPEYGAICIFASREFKGDHIIPIASTFEAAHTVNVVKRAAEIVAAASQLPPGAPGESMSPPSMPR